MPAGGVQDFPHQSRPRIWISSGPCGSWGALTLQSGAWHHLGTPGDCWSPIPKSQGREWYY